MKSALQTLSSRNKQQHHSAPKDGGATAIMVPTKKADDSLNAEETKIDLRQMDENDVKSLQQSDPFMYYSIPAVHKASLLFTDVDYSDIATSNRHADSNPPRPPQLDDTGEEPAVQESVEEDANKVSRRTRVSFECHPRVHLEDIVGELEEEFDVQLLDSDNVVSMLGRLFSE